MLKRLQTERVESWSAEMNAELLSRAKVQDIKREVNLVRLAAAAKSARPSGRRNTPDTELRTVPAMPLRLLRALRLAS